MIVGVAICDILTDFRDHLERVAILPVQALELQPELDSWQPHPLGKRFSFLSVHAPSAGRDIASPDEAQRVFAVAAVKRGMEFAQAVNADAYLIHPGQILAPDNIAGIAVPESYQYRSEYFKRNPDERERRLDVLEVSFRELASFYHNKGFTFDLCLENLPFPELGATLVEYGRVYERLAAIFPLWLTLDVAHAYVSYWYLLQHPLLASRTNGYPATSGSFYDDLARWVSKYRRMARYYHLHGATADHDHLPIDARPEHPDSELDIPLVIHILGRNKPLIIEVHGYPVQTMLDSARHVENLLTKLEGQGVL